MNAVVLQRPDHLQAGAVPDVGEAWIFMPAKISLQNAAVFRAIENCAPLFEFAHPVRRFLGVKLGHAPLIYVLAAAHRVREVDLPVVAIVDIGQGSCDSTLGHDGMGFTEKRFANKPDRNSRSRCLDCGAQSGAAGADYENIVLMSLVFGHGRR
jgi:hypothetical protein